MKNDFYFQLKEIADNWTKAPNIVLDFSPYGFPGLTKQSIIEALIGLVTMTELLSEYKGYEPSKVSSYALVTTISSLRAYAAQHVPSNPQPHIPELLRLIELTRSTLKGWLEEADPKNKKAIPSLVARLATVMGQMEDAARLYEDLKASQEKLQQAALQAKTASQEATSANTSIASIRESAQQAAEQIESFEAEAQVNAKTVSELTEDLKTLKLELDEGKATQLELINAFESYKLEIRNLIGAASQVGMASSFRIMKMGYERAQRAWLLAFVGAVLVLLEVGVMYVGPAIVHENWIAILIKLPLTFPAIWLAWFFAKQYGFTTRLREDYGFKYASAMAFEAHKREAQEISETLLRKLLDTSIQNYADNPLRIFGEKNHASPAHEFIDKITSQLIKDPVDLIKKVLEALKK